MKIGLPHQTVLGGMRKARNGLVFFVSVALLHFFSPVLCAAAETIEVVVRGLEEDPSALANVTAALALPQGLVQAGNVNRRWLDRFVEEAPGEASKALEPFGYYNAVVTAGLESVGEGRYRVVVTVVTGMPVRVKSVDVRVEGPGAGEESLASLIEKFPLKAGEVLRQDFYEEAKGKMKSEAVQLGYLDADYPVHKIVISKSELSARIVLVLETGSQYRFDETTFEGIPEYPLSFLKRYLAYKPGQIFSFEKIGKTQLNLLNADRFTDVIVTPEKEKAVGLDVPIVITMKPLPTKRLRIGVGYGTDTGPRLKVEYKDVNVFDSGHLLEGTLNASQRLGGIAIRYVIPGSRDIDTFTAFQFNAQREEGPTYTSRIISVEADKTKSLGRGRLRTFFFKVQDEHYSVTSEKNNARLLMPGIRFSSQRFDSLIRPTRGHRYAVEMEGTHQALGSSLGLVRGVFEGNLIVPLPWRLSLLTRLQAGVAFLNTSFDNYPASLRFFAGGTNSVRGYSYQSLGPKNANGEVIGGKNVLVGSIEFDRALFSDWGVAVFYDVGNAFNALNDITLYQGAGLGVRYYTRVGALKLDFARQVGVPSPGFRVHFTIGFQI